MGTSIAPALNSESDRPQGLKDETLSSGRFLDRASEHHSEETESSSGVEAPLD